MVVAMMAKVFAEYHRFVNLADPYYSLKNLKFKKI